MCSLLAAVDKTISDLPKTEKPPRGWCDVNDPTTQPLLLARNRDHERWITTGTAASKFPRQRAAHRTRNCNWPSELQKTNGGRRSWHPPTTPAYLLPGGSARRDPCAFWKQAKHASRGSSKWKPRQRAFTRNAAGDQALTVAESVTNICDYFSSICNFDTRPEAAAHIDRMQQIQPDRSYLSPRTHEILTAVRALKHKAPGLSGAPICASSPHSYRTAGTGRWS
jgi:hypothetical protein